MVSGTMSIEKESHGFPEVNVHRRTTKVNVSMVIAVLLFFAIAAGVAVWIGGRADTPDGAPPGRTENR